MTAMIKTTLRPLAQIVGLTILCGCASVPSPVQELEAATAALQSARDLGAPQLAGLQWQAAQEKFASANQLLEQKQNIAARRALQQTTVDAQLAGATAQLQQRTAEQRALQDEIDQLQQRIQELGPREPVQ